MTPLAFNGNHFSSCRIHENNFKCVNQIFVVGEPFFIFYIEGGNVSSHFSEDEEVTHTPLNSSSNSTKIFWVGGVFQQNAFYLTIC